jgi:hypothetical protein
MLPWLSRQIEETEWQSVPSEVRRLVKLAAGPARVIHTLSYDLPDADAVSVWYNPDSQDALFHGTSGEKAASWAESLSAVPFVNNVVQVRQPIPVGDGGEPWLLVKKALQTPTVLGPIAMLAGHKPGVWPTAPNTLTATLGSSLLGAGLGYGAGWLGEHLLPDDKFEKGKLRRTGAVLGGLLGGVPSLWYGIRGGYKQASLLPESPKIAEAKAGLEAALSPEERTLHPMFERAVARMFKSADAGDGGFDPAPGGGGAMFLPRIQTDQFNKVIWNDPFTPVSMRAATTGLLEAASMLRGGVNVITPLDIARIGLGAGSGYASASLVGKTLGALAGLKPESQQELQRMGTWAGIITNVVPLAFGQR